MKKYNKAPLPFQGQKRNFLKIFNRELEKLCGDGDGWTIIDVFGGSGLLAHNAKYTCRKARVIFNDYDDYQSRLSRINETEQIRKELLSITKDVDKIKSIPLEIKNKVIDYLKNKEKEWKLDYHTISCYLMFSGNFIHSIEEMNPRNLYKRTAIQKLDCEGYLTEVERIRKCFTELLKEKIDGKVLYLLDPPYINTMQGYHRDKSSYFGLLSQLTLFELIKPPFFYFTSNKSEVAKLVNATDINLSKIFNNSNIFSLQSPVNNVGSYKDILIIKTS